ncbi:U11/U12 small nuclear ribonucleoprotein 59 kDa protein [Ananas comosus]|uniref:U11/U12 small nuclear ribonucleoprotein 59 kDa protein n=1 Tax=Ananas comosus TaxID=4615 RepID=A0A199W6U6_ANACO|nr:U11/U12 small nuclear ribonucleoprotein 59 kDa protein [Ananas comosus]
MIPSPLSFGQSCQSPPWQPAQPSFWESDNVRQHLAKLRETITISKPLLNELQEILLLRKLNESNAQEDSTPETVLQEIVNRKRINLDAQESLSIEAANSLCSHLKLLLGPLSSITNQASPWEERSAAVRLAQKRQKSVRNTRWRKRKRKQFAELLRKERENYDKADQEADEWRAREIAKDIARRKMESMKEIAKQKANEERKRLESELELVLVVEKLQELRSIRIQKLKKQGKI